MRLYIFTELSLNDAIDNTIERIEEDNKGRELFIPRPVIVDLFIEQAEKSGHIIERNYFGELSEVNILQTLKNCFPKNQRPDDNSDFLFRKGR